MWHHLPPHNSIELAKSEVYYGCSKTCGTKNPLLQASTTSILAESELYRFIGRVREIDIYTSHSGILDYYTLALYKEQGGLLT